MLIGKEFTFDSAHNLINYNGRCANLHGHTYKLHVISSDKVKKNGLVLDFGEIKDIVNKKVISVLDHKYLNEIIKQPSAENISIWIWKQLEKDLPLFEIKLWESPTNFVSYQGKIKKRK
jgi:6-pyruvoyltetrahydropterin/6-carboxytetrahydropterin synthase